jgi:peptidoglycan/LPS O-acetylase OafA/YrhL
VTPLIAGHQAVMLFFVLSGFVLSLAFWNKGSNGPYGRYLVRRFFRIYVPFGASAAMAAVGAHFFLFSHLPLSPWFYVTWQTALTPKFLIAQLLFWPDSALNTAFWSLRYEAQLSIVFPMLLLLLRRLGGWGSLVFALAVYAAGVYLPILSRDKHYYQETLRYTCMFVAGALLARYRAALRHEKLWSSRTIRVSFVLAGAVMYFWGDRFAVKLQCPGLDDLFVTVGASALIVSALCVPALGHALRHRLPTYLGRVSYSLYLVHGTALFVLLNLFYGKMPNLLLALIYGVVTFLVSHAFCIWVEEPSLQWGKRLAVGKPAPGR